MAKMFDKLLLFLYSLTILIASGVVLAAAFAWIPQEKSQEFVHDLYVDYGTMIPVTTAAVLVFVVSLRFLYITLRRGRGQAPSIDQRTDFGDIRISLDTVENLALKAAGRHRSMKDLRARVSVNDAGLDIVIRTLVDGETSIPEMTEELQRLVKRHVEDITGIPVAAVSVYVANVIPSHSFRSRVE